MQKYETIFVVDSLLKSEEIDNIIAKYERFISDNGGKIEYVDRVGKKRLAYEIKKRQYGYYAIIVFDGPPQIVKQLEREYRLNESLLRFITVKLDKHALKAYEKQKVEGFVAKRYVEESAEHVLDTPVYVEEDEIEIEHPIGESENPEAGKESQTGSEEKVE